MGGDSRGVRAKNISMHPGIPLTHQPQSQLTVSIYQRQGEQLGVRCAGIYSGMRNELGRSVSRAEHF